YHPGFASRWAFGVSCRTLRVITGIVVILHPFHHVSTHIIEAPRIRLLRRYRVSSGEGTDVERTLPASGCRTSVIPSFPDGSRIWIIRSSAGRVLPLGFG